MEGLTYAFVGSKEKQLETVWMNFLRIVVYNGNIITTAN